MARVVENREVVRPARVSSVAERLSPWHGSGTGARGPDALEREARTARGT